VNTATPVVARVARAGVVTLFLVLVLWELVLAPLRPGGSWLVVKALPLALLLPGVLRGERRALQWLALLLPFHFAEGIVRGWSEEGRHAFVAWGAALLAGASFAAVLRWTGDLRRAKQIDGTA
jgi:uncharacterized membrane protein